MMMASGDPFDGAIAVTRSPNQSPDSNPAVWNAAIVWPGPGSATVSIALNAMRAELGHIGSSCTQVVSVNCEMLSGVLKNDALEIRVEKTRVGGRFAFLRSTLVNLGQLDGKKQPKEAVISTISAVFCAPERTPKSPPFPSSPRRVVPPKFEDCVSLQSLIEKYRKPNLMIKESWDWKMDPAFAANLQSVIENAEKDGLDVTGVRQRIADFVEKIKGNVGFYFYHLSGRPIDESSLLLFSDIISPLGFLLLNVTDVHEKHGFPFLTLSFTVNYTGSLRLASGEIRQGLRGVWGKVKYKGDFADMEEREVVMRDEGGEAVCVGRQNAIWRVPLKRQHKL